jgi:hypothetical protein
MKPNVGFVNPVPVRTGTGVGHVAVVGNVQALVGSLFTTTVICIRVNGCVELNGQLMAIVLVSVEHIGVMLPVPPEVLVPVPVVVVVVVPDGVVVVAVPVPVVVVVVPVVLVDELVVVVAAGAVVPVVVDATVVGEDNTPVTDPISLFLNSG